MNVGLEVPSPVVVLAAVALDAGLELPLHPTTAIADMDNAIEYAKTIFVFTFAPGGN
jgi:hypothetical protein